MVTASAFLKGELVQTHADTKYSTCEYNARGTPERTVKDLVHTRTAPNRAAE